MISSGSESDVPGKRGTLNEEIGRRSLGERETPEALMSAFVVFSLCIYACEFVLPMGKASKGVLKVMKQLYKATQNSTAQLGCVIFTISLEVLVKQTVNRAGMLAPMS